jgi:hypothetical protein
MLVAYPFGVISRAARPSSWDADIRTLKPGRTAVLIMDLGRRLPAKRHNILGLLQSMP